MSLISMARSNSRQPNNIIQYWCGNCKGQTLQRNTGYFKRKDDSSDCGFLDHCNHRLRRTVVAFQYVNSTKRFLAVIMGVDHPTHFYFDIPEAPHI
jgi:hypothetical protein